LARDFAIYGNLGAAHPLHDGTHMV
jgi:hypothetical protein